MKNQSCHDIETSHLIWANQMFGFYMIANLAFNELISEAKFGDDF